MPETIADPDEDAIQMKTGEERASASGAWGRLMEVARGFLGVGVSRLPDHEPARRQSWGWAPELCFVMSIALLCMALVQIPPSFLRGWAEFIFWAGMTAALLPVAARLVWPRVTRRELLTLVLLLGAGLYVVKILRSPVGFTHFDEFLHWKTMLDILERDSLFGSNSLLPVSQLYPALEIITSAVVNLSGLPIFPAALVVIGVGRLVFLCSMFLLFETLTGSARAAAIGCAVFMANANFVVFQAQFAYESVAFVFLIVALLAETRWTASGADGRAYLSVIVLTLGALALTHHLTSYFAAIFLVGVAVLELLRPGSDQRGRVIAVAAIAVSVAYGWSHTIGGSTSAYLGPVIENGLKELVRLVTSPASARTPLVGETGQAPPLFNRLTVTLGMALICLALANGFFRSLALAGASRASPSRRRRLFPGIVWADSRLTLFTLLTLAFPLSVVLRLSSSSWEVGNRLGTFAFLGVGVVAATAVAGLWLGRTTNRLRVAAAGVSLAIMLLSGVVLGLGPDPIFSRYKVGADTMSVESIGIDSARWARQWLGEGNRVAADRINMVLLATYGEQIPVTSLNDHVDISYVLFASDFADEQLAAIRDGAIDYLMIDLRLTTALPEVGAYVDAGEDAEVHVRPPATRTLLKYDSLAGVSRPFDNGVTVVYDVRSLRAPN